MATKSFKVFHLLQKKKSVQTILVAKNKLTILQSDHSISYLNIFHTSCWDLYMLTKGMGKEEIPFSTKLYMFTHKPQSTFSRCQEQ